MNKKVLSAILFSALFAGSGTFTSCIDTDEPAGIEELRGAKAELIRAKVSVEQANAALLLAQAEVEKAKAAKTNAEAEIEKAKAAKAQAEAELAEITNEAKRAELEMTIAKNEQILEQNAVLHQTTMLGLQQSLAEAQRKYELALAQIEIAKAVCSDADKKTLAQLKLAVVEAQGKVATAAGEVADAEEAYYNMTIADKYFGEFAAEYLEKQIADAEQGLKDAQDDLAKWENYANADTVAVDWMEEIAVMEDSVAAILDVQYKKEVALGLLMESEEYALLKKTYFDAQKAYDDQVVDSVYSFEMLDIESGAEITETLALTERGTAVTDAEVTEEEAKAAAAADAIAYLKDVDNEGAGYIADLEQKIASYTTEKKYWLDSIAAMIEKDDAADAEAVAKDLKAWEDALAAFKAAKTISTDAMVNAKGEGALKTYNDAIAAADGDATKIVVAKQNFADAIVAFFAGLPANQFTYNTITLKTGKNAADQDTYATKNIKEWLTGNEKAIYFDLLVRYFDGDVTKFWTEGDKETVKAGEAASANATGAVAAYIHKRGAGETADALILEEGAPTTLYGKLVKASFTAFGGADKWAEYVGGDMQDGYLHNKPTAEDAAYVFANLEADDSMGSYGLSLVAENKETAFEAKNYEAIIENLEAAVAYWTAKWNILVANVAAAEEAVEVAEAAVEEYAKQWTGLEEELEEIENRVARLSKMTALLKEAVMVYMPAEYEGDEDGLYDVDGFAEFLNDQVVEAKKAVKAAEIELARANMNAELALDGKYDPFVAAKETLDAAVAKLEAAQAELDEAAENLKKGLEIIAAVNAAE